MKKNLILICCIALTVMFSACHQKSSKKVGKEEMNERTELLQLYHVADSIYYLCGRIDTAAFQQFIDKALVFTEKYPQDTISSDMLYRAGIGTMILAKAAETRDNTAKYAKQALKIFYDFQEKYPQDEQAKYCYYQRGIIYDDILGDAASAEDQYRDFINRYPQDSLARQLEQYLKILGLNERQVEKTLGLDE